MAIAFDNATNGGNVTATSQTISHTVSGADPFLFVSILGRVSATSAVTGVTYNSVALTYIGGQQIDPSDRFFECWYLVGPSTGTNNLIISASSSDFLAGSVASYTRVVGNPNATAINFQTTGSPNTNTLTPTVDNSWHIMGVGSSSGIPTAGTGSTLRATANGNSVIMDGNGPITPAASNSIGATGMNSSFGSGTIGISVSPSANSLNIKW